MKIGTDTATKMTDDESFDEPPNERDMQVVTYEDANLAHSVLAGMDTLRHAGQLCDCVLRVGKKLAEFAAHQAVLASISPHFMAMFEQDPRTETRKSYNVKETTPEVFQVLLDYAYTGRLNMCLSHIEDIYQAACQLKFHKVSKICSDHLINNLDISTCIDVRNFVGNFVGNNPTLMDRTNKFIQANMTAIKTTKAFLLLPQINIKLLGYSRGINGGPDSDTVSKLISDWLLASNVQDGDSTARSEQMFSIQSSYTHWSDGTNVAVDMQVLTEHENVLFLDADNHLQDVSSMDQDVSKTDAVLDYVKACKKYNKKPKHLNTDKSQVSDQRNGSHYSPVNMVAHEKVHPSLYSVLLSICGTLHHVAVRMHTLQGSSRYASAESGLNRNSSGNYSSSNSSTEEDEKCNGLDTYYLSSLSSFEPLAEMSNSRCGVGLASWEGKLIALGGNDRGECLNTVETFNSESNTWSSLPNMSCARGRFDCAVLSGKLYACGGSDGRKELDSVECFDGTKWFPVTKMPSSKSSSGVGVLNSKLYVIGGYNGQRAEKSCEVYDEQTKTWTSIAKLNEGRSQSTVCSNNGLLYVFGGTDSWNCFSSVEVYNPTTNQWLFVASMSQARRGAAATVFKGKVYIVGGSDGSKSLDTVEIYDCNTNTWSNGPALHVPRSNAGLAVLAGRLYITGGYGKNKFLANMEVLEGDTDSQWCSYHKNGSVFTSSDSDADH